MSDSINHLAPLKTRTVSITRFAPWYPPEMSKMKTAGRRLERRSRKTGLTVHALAYKDQVTTYTESLNEAKTHINPQPSSPSLTSDYNLLSTSHLLYPLNSVNCEFFEPHHLHPSASALTLGLISHSIQCSSTSLQIPSQLAPPTYPIF